MQVTRESFIQLLGGTQALLPFGKMLPVEALAVAWLSWPKKAKAEVDSVRFSYAITQFILDGDRPKDVPIHIAVLRYLYPCRNGLPVLEKGLRPDLADRMARPDALHELTPQAANALPPAAIDSPHHAPHGVLAQLGVTPGMRGASVGKRLAIGSLQGYWTLEDLDRASNHAKIMIEDAFARGRQAPPVADCSLARDWISSHPMEWAALLTEALAAESLAGARS